MPGDPYTNPPKDETTTRPGNEDTAEPYPLRPVSPDHFERAKKELAEDLVRKGRQIEYLIEKLPGLSRGEEQQAEDIKLLVEQVKETEALRKQKRKEMRECVRQLDNVIMGMAKSISVPTTNGTSTNGIDRG